MKFNLNEDIHKKLEVEPSEYLDYSVQEVVIKDSDMRNYLDKKYDADTIIKLAQQIDNIENNDLDTAYEMLIDYYEESEFDDEHLTDDLRDMYNYLEDCVYTDYGDIAQEEYNEAARDSEEIADFEDTYRYRDIQGSGLY